MLPSRHPLWHGTIAGAATAAARAIDIASDGLRVISGCSSTRMQAAADSVSTPSSSYQPYGAKTAL